MLFTWSLMLAMMRAFSTLLKLGSALASAMVFPFVVGVGVIADVFIIQSFERIAMRPLKRMGVSKRKSARTFRNQIGRTKAPNVMMGSQRGGWRL